MILFPDENDDYNKDINPVTKVALKKSIPKRAAKTFGVSVEDIFAGDLVRYQYDGLLKREGHMLTLHFM